MILIVQLTDGEVCELEDGIKLLSIPRTLDKMTLKVRRRIWRKLTLHLGEEKKGYERKV